MKYMGHKGKLLSVLGDILIEESKSAQSIADPFCGSGAVSWFLAQNTNKSVISGDLQSFAVYRAAAVTQRTTPLEFSNILNSWKRRANKILSGIVEKFPNSSKSVEPDPSSTDSIIRLVMRSRIFCETVLPPILAAFGKEFPITKAYGGYYFSPLQALTLDTLRSTLPKENNARTVAMAALIETASRCAAAPGHTAQPFQPTSTSAKYILEAWERPVDKLLEEALNNISGKYAQCIGSAKVSDFSKTIENLQEGDLVFADPPYSDVHYSRFYHVLETLTQGKEVAVSGRGRYPEISMRPSSQFSQKSQSTKAALELITSCHKKQLGLVITFPSESSSNGLSAQDFMSMGKNLFSSIERHEISSDFSTLGGNKKIRSARLKCSESIICFRP
ncbi:TPA: DNA adenine methylase [Pseudomonas aeruginosa]|nr:DNA adenine methylase [Pseudomonas aeruginosa]